MVCQACGLPITGEVRFCPRCGAQIAQPAAPQGYAPQPVQGYAPPYAAPMMLLPRVRRHLQTLGVLWCVFAVYRFLGLLFGIFAFRLFAFRSWDGQFPFRHWHTPWGMPWMNVMPVIIGIGMAAAVFGAIVGYSLLTRQPWGRVLAIVAGILVLFKPLLGTALGIYTLWVLAPASSALEYEVITEQG